MIEFSCHTWAFNDLTLMEALGTIARLGFRRVDIGSGPGLNAPRAAAQPAQVAAEITADLEQFNLELSDLYLMLPRITDAERGEREVELFKALLPFIVALEAPGVTLSPGLAYPDNDAGAYERVMEALNEIMEAARLATPATRLRVSIEPHMDSMAQKPEVALQLLKDVKGLELTLDWAHLICQDVFHDDIVALIPKARHVQVRQAARAQLQLPFDRGSLQPEKVIAALQEAGYTGVLSDRIPADARLARHRRSQRPGRNHHSARFPA
ncbi:sugar phosphate isomerase/epimerase [bacterium]|nr:sugar phosphate isomerase/epimerase [bacterium]